MMHDTQHDPVSPAHSPIAHPSEADSGPESTPNFARFLQDAVAHEREGDTRNIHYVRDVAALLDGHGISADVVRPEAAPRIYALKYLNEEDWRHISAQEPDEVFFTLWSRANRRQAEAALKRRPFDVADYTRRADIERLVADEIIWKVAPVTHVTTVEALEAAFADGGFVSSRELLETKGLDKTWDGRTLGDERKNGSDRYVYGSCPRPHTSYMNGTKSEVIVVLSPDALHQPGTIITGDELEEYEYRDGLNQRENFHEQYLSTLAQPEDFEMVGRGVLDHLRLGDEHSLWSALGGYDKFSAPPYNMLTFSAFEVKMPRTPTSMIRKLLFTDEAQARAFVERHGDQIPVEVVPDIQAALDRSGGDVLGYRPDFDKAYQEAIGSDPRIQAFDARLAELGEQGMKHAEMRRFLGMDR